MFALCERPSRVTFSVPSVPPWCIKETMMQTPNTYRAGPDADGHFGIHGGRYVAETLMPLVLAVEAAYDAAKADPAFKAALDYYLKHYVCPTNPLYVAEPLTRHF